MTGPIVRAVTAAIEDGTDHLWHARVRGGCGHAMHVVASGPDGYDSIAFRQLATMGICQRARLTHCERADQTLRPMLLFMWGDDFERRSGPRLGADHRADHLYRLPAEAL